jgi:HEAT repeat protein
MKRQTVLFTFFLLVAFPFLAYAQSTAYTQTFVKKDCVKKSLLLGVESENLGLQSCAAYMLGEFCCDEAVVPLLKILHNSPYEEMRIMAALSLYKIGDSRGIYAIRQAIKFDDSKRVRKLCDKFYRAYLQAEEKLVASFMALK